MADIEFNLSGSVPCTGRGSGYVGVLYHQPGRRPKRTQVILPGNKVVKAKEPGELVRLTQDSILDRLGEKIDQKQLIALAITRLCMRATHEVGERTLADSFRAERVGAFAIAKSYRAEELAVRKRLEKQISAHGIGHARRENNMTPIDPLIHLPITYEEAQTHYIVAAIPAYAKGPTIDKQPYIALHYSADKVIEQIVLPEQL